MDLKPSDFSVTYPWSSVVNKTEHEIVALNIMKILVRTGNVFRELSWEEYSEERKKDNEFTMMELESFNAVIKYCRSGDTAVLFSERWNDPSIWVSQQEISGRGTLRIDTQPDFGDGNGVTDTVRRIRILWDNQPCILSFNYNADGAIDFISLMTERGIKINLEDMDDEADQELEDICRGSLIKQGALKRSLMDRLEKKSEDVSLENRPRKINWRGNE